MPQNLRLLRVLRVENLIGYSSHSFPRAALTADGLLSRKSASSTCRTVRGTAVIVWFRNDLRVLDNEALYEAWRRSDVVLHSIHHGFPKTGALRAVFLIGCPDDLKKNLVKGGLDLLIQHGKPEELLPCLDKAFGAHAVYAQKVTCSEEVDVENLVKKDERAFEAQKLGESTRNPEMVTTATLMSLLPRAHFNLKR